jgi:hypothetical protein
VADDEELLDRINAVQISTEDLLDLGELQVYKRAESATPRRRFTTEHRHDA